MDEENTTQVYLCDYSFVATTTQRIAVFVIGPLVMTGLLLNTLNVLVLRRTKSSSNAFFMLQFMAVSDILYLLMCFLYFPFRRIFALIREGDDVYKREDWFIATDMLLVVDPLYHLFLVARNWVIVVITVERLLNIMVPFWARTTITKFRIKVTIFIIYAIATVIHSSKWYTWETVYGVNECSGEPAMFIYHYPGLLAIEHYMYITTTVMLPVCIIYVANVLLILSLRRSFLERAAMGSDAKENETQQRQAVVIVLAMSLVFTVFETPLCVDRFIYFFTGYEADFMMLVRRSSVILNMTDSTVNFFAYCASSRPFRKSLVQLVRGAPRSTGNSKTQSAMITNT